MSKQVSNCCGSSFRFRGEGTEGTTVFYVCDKCQRACDPVSTKPKQEGLGTTEQFINYVSMFKQWFKDEEVEVSDWVLGRFASRLNLIISNQRREAQLELVEKMEKKSVQDLIIIMGSAYNDLSVKVAFKEGYNQAIDDLKKLVEEKDE